MQPGDAGHDPWTRLVEITAEARSVFLREWAGSSDPGASRERAQSELDARVQCWAIRLDPGAIDPAFRQLRGEPAGRASSRGRIATIVVVSVLIIAVLTPWGGVVAFAVITLVVFFGAVLLTGMSLLRTRLWGRSRLTWGRALREGLCPGCAYDLAGISHFGVGGEVLRDVGPERCPECGAPWPLVPPPVPGTAAV